MTPGAHDRLAITFGVQEAAWSGGGPPVRFCVIARGARGTRVLWARTLDPARVAADRVALRRSGAAASGVDAERQRALRALGYVQ